MVVVLYGVRATLVWRQTRRSPLVAFAGGDPVEIAMAVGALLWFPLIALYVWRGPFGPWLVAGPAYAAFHWLGALALTLALSVLVASIVHIGKAWRIGVDRANTPELVTRGLYAHVRHPIYTGLQLTALGTFAMAPNAMFAVVLVLVFAATLRQARREEAFLAELFGDRYREYAARTGRFLPRLRS